MPPLCDLRVAADNATCGDRFELVIRWQASDDGREFKVPFSSKRRSHSSDQIILLSPSNNDLLMGRVYFKSGRYNENI